MKTAKQQLKTDLLPFSQDRLQMLFPILTNRMHPVMIEQMLFDMAEKFTESADGFWQFTQADRYTIAVPPDQQQPYKISVNTNGYDGEMDRYTFGAALTLFILNSLLWQFENRISSDEMEKHTNEFHKIKEAVHNDSRFDVNAIESFLD